MLKNPSQLDLLPTPAELPDADVVIYDGKCVFCERQVRNLKWFDGKNRLAFVSLHDPWVAERYPDLTYDQMMDQMYVVPNAKTGRDNERHGGAEALRYLSARLPKLWLAAPLFHLPFTMPIQQWVYRQVANRRYKIAGEQPDACGEDGTCDLHLKK
jgi:predicted DCC family thiol-disulfide oxidoreductase YuxK